MNTTLSPSVLRWARERAGLSENELAEKTGVDLRLLTEWENSGSIPFDKVDLVAQKTHTPFGYLFLSHPPEESLPIADFRRVAGAEGRKPSPDLLDVLHAAQRRQNWYREYLIANREDPLPFVGKFTKNDPFKETARDIRTRLQIGPELASSTQNWEEAFRLSIEAIEDGGILVMRAGYAGGYTHRKLKVEEFRGFALSDAHAPLVFINGADAPTAQMFTLAHEVAHIWLGESGVSNLEKTYVSTNGVEAYCNNVAAEVLLPLTELEASWQRISGTDAEVDRLSKRYKVSRVVVARRAFDAGYITRDKYNSYFGREVANARKASGGNYYLNEQYQNSRRFSVALIRDTREGKTLYRDAMQLLGIKKKDTFRKYVESLKMEL